MTLQLQGIGARLRFADGNTTVECVVPGGSAAADGRLTTGDTIVAVRQSDDMLLPDVVGMKLSRVVDLIRGPADTVVRLKIQKATGESVIYDLTRTTVKLEGQEAHGTVIESGRWIDGATTRIGVLSLPSFYRDFQGAANGGQFKSTSHDVQKILALFRDQKVEALIVDLRGNGGGALDESVEVSGLFIPQGPVVQIQSKAGPVSVLSDQDPEMHWRGPLIVVCDRLSASASEILAGAIRDYRRGIIVGDPTTHGKGTVQNVISLSSRISLLRQQDHGVLKLTVAKWYRVNGDGSQIHGIPADIAIPSIRSTLEKGEAALENSIPFDRIATTSFLPFTNYVTDETLQQLRKTSAERIKLDSDFKKLNQQIAFLVEQQEKNAISLNETVARQNHAELEELSAVDQGDPETTDDEMRFRNTFYNRELVSITVDYARLLQAEVR
jgi:carboxyl-terminal processing protease